MKITEKIVERHYDALKSAIERNVSNLRSTGTGDLVVITRTDARAALSAALGGVEGGSRTCVWTHRDDEGTWMPACCGIEGLYQFTNDGPVENGHKYCHRCSGLILLPSPPVGEGKP